MNERGIHPEITQKNTSEVIDLDEARKLRELRRKFGHDVLTTDAIATEATAGYNVEATADKIQPGTATGNHSETTANLAAVAELTDPEEAATQEFDDEVQAVTAEATENISNLGVEADETAIQEVAEERLVAAAVESTGETNQDRDEFTTDQREHEAAQAVATQVLADQIEEDNAPLVTQDTQTDLRAQLLDKDTEKLDNHHLAEIGEDAVVESKANGSVETLKLYDEDGNSVEVTHNTDTARRVALALRGKFDEATKGVGHEGRENIWQRLEYLKETHGNDLSKARLSPIEYKRLERTIARELEFSGVTTTQYRDAA